MWEQTSRPNCALEKDLSNPDPDDSVHGDLWFCRASGEHYVEVTNAPEEPGRWFRLVGYIYYRCTEQADSPYVNTLRTTSAAEFAHAGASGDFGPCHACGGTHALSKANTTFRPE